MGWDGTVDRAEAGGSSGQKVPPCRAGRDLPMGALVRAGPNFRHEPEPAWPVIHVTPRHVEADHD